MRFRITVAALSVLGFAACGGSGGSSSPTPAPSAPPPPPVTFNVGGTASGLNGTVVLRNNGGDNLTIATNGAFTFATRVNTGGAYAVTVLTQPATQTCAITGATGTVTANVTQVALACVDNAPPAPAVPLVDEARAASGAVGIGGGTVSVTSARGITYTLQVPAGAVDAAVQIRMTPVVNMGGAPLSAGLLGAVRFEPAGLKFLKSARLTISPLPLAGGRPLLAGFNTANDGGNFNLNAVERVGTSVIVDVAHFSIAGASEATSAELAEIPLEPLGPTFTTDAARTTVFRLLFSGSGENVEQVAEVMQRWYATLVQPLIEGAVSVDADSQERALAAYMEWIQTYDRLVALGVDTARLNPRLSTAFAHARERMPDVLLMYVDSEIDSCFEDESLAHLTMASLIQQLSANLGFAPIGSPLDRASFRARVNDCLRVVLDPITLPGPLTIGQDSSLDARAQVVFNENPNPVAAPFQFTVTPTNATVATSPGFSSAEGRFTTVFRPTALPVSFIVRACLVLPALEVSDICVAQNVSTPGGPLVLSKRINNTFNGEHGPSGVVNSFVIQGTGSEFQGATASYAVTRDTVNAIDRGGFIDARASCASTLPNRSGQASIDFSIVVNVTAPSTARIRGSGAYSGSTTADSLNSGRGTVLVSVERPNASQLTTGTGSELGAPPFELLAPLTVGENVITMLLSAACTGTSTAAITNTFEVVFE